MTWQKAADRIMIVCAAFIAVTLALGLLATYAPGALQTIAGIAGIGAGVVLYMFPWLVARQRHAANVGSVAVVNVLLGWTLIGWVVALAMAMRDVKQD